MRTSRAATLVVATIITAAVAGGYAVDRHEQSSRAAASPSPSPSSSPSPSPLASSAPPRPAVLDSLDAAAAVPTTTGVSSDLAPAAVALSSGAHLVGEVIDATTGARLWSRGATQPEPPASTTKLLTAAAALTELGPSARLVTRTRLAGGTVYLVGGGDPTLVRSATSYFSPTYPQPATLAALARRTVATLGATRRIRLRLDTGAWSGPRLARGWKPSYVTEGDVTPPSPLELDEGRLDPHDEFAARSENPAAAAGEAFAALLATDGVHVQGDVTSGGAGADSTPLATVSSAPVAELVQRMLTVSDDDLAEALGRAVAIKRGLPPTFGGAAAAVKASIASLGVPTSGVTLQDTSGLSHQDRISPQALVGVLRAAVSPAHPALRAVVEGLPVAGLTGTLALRFTERPSAAAAGVLRAKTGTLTGVNTLAGVVVDHSGRLLIFAFLTWDAPSPALTVPALDRLAARLSHCGCGSAD